MYTQTRSETCTFTEARARAIFPKIFTDIINLEMSGIISKNRSESWREILSYGLYVNAFIKFEVKLYLPNGKKEAFRYHVRDDGTITGNDSSGGIDFYSYPSGTTAGILVTRKNSFLEDSRLNHLYEEHGWTTGGEYLEGQEVSDREFSKDGYGISRTRIIQ